jgi:hypothetical protein
MRLHKPIDLATTARRYMADTEQAGAKVFVSNLVILDAYFAARLPLVTFEKAAARLPHTQLLKPPARPPRTVDPDG